MKYWLERSYPYITAIVITIMLQRVADGVMANDNFEDLLSGLVTLDSIIIGFMGAIMPVVLSMKNESKFVRYVFENDEKGLFGKYLKVTVFTGLLSAVFSLTLYLRDSFVHGFVKDSLYSVWVFFSALFFLTTYRSLVHMITLVFSKDNFATTDNLENNRQKTDAEINLEEKYGK